MNRMLVIIFLLGCGYLHAQDSTVKKIRKEATRNINRTIPDTVNVAWITGGAYNANLSQASLSNWAAGGDKFSLTLNTHLHLFSYYKNNKHNWDNALDLNLGYLKSTTLDARKNDDRIDFISKYGYEIAKKWKVVGMVNFRSQMLKGYAYETGKETTRRQLVSAFMSPGYILVSPGIEYRLDKSFSAFISPISARWTIVTNDSLSAAGTYGVDSGQHVKTEVGAFATFNLLKDFNKTFSLKSRLDLYSNYLHHPKNVDVFFANILFMRLTDMVSVTYNLDMIYDDDVKLFGPQENAPALQLKSILGVGLVVKF